MRRPIAIFAAGLVIRLVALAYLAHVMPQMLSWGFNEAGGIARWIVTKHAFSSPFHDAQGPTAWLAPVYPLIVASIFLVFGVQTPASAVAVMVFNAVCSAATGVIVYQIGKEIHSDKAGLFAGWLWAFSPPTAILPFIPWDTSLSALILSAALLMVLRLQSGKSDGWTACGATWGVAALVNPALLVPLPVLALLLTEWRKRWRSALIMMGVAALVILPWTVRNYVVFQRIMLVRSNGLAEVYFGNCGFDTHPLGQSMEYQRLGEAEFTARANTRAIEYIRTHPAAFLHNSIHRAMWFWIYPTNFWVLSVGIDIAASLGLIVVFKKSPKRASMVLAILTIYPLIYYASQSVSRYRHPIDPVLYSLSGIAWCRLKAKQNERQTEA
ncbi:MAG: glycosyltransferase family 39 protein [Acidobacteriota bacterium]|nr:glycosyltransferase family 39 protein [Acidobacteriota bacterium]